MSQLNASYRVTWVPIQHYVTMDGDEVMEFGLDALMNKYYRTAKAIYVKQTDCWVRVT